MSKSMMQRIKKLQIAQCNKASGIAQRLMETRLRRRKGESPERIGLESREANQELLKKCRPFSKQELACKLAIKRIDRREKRRGESNGK